jgi:hypothetical protein
LRLWCALFHGKYRERYVRRVRAMILQPEHWVELTHCFKCKYPPFMPNDEYLTVSELESAERQRRIRSVSA